VEEGVILLGQCASAAVSVVLDVLDGSANGEEHLVVIRTRNLEHEGVAGIEQETDSIKGEVVASLAVGAFLRAGENFVDLLNKRPVG
jgi:hypothetical protein